MNTFDNQYFLIMAENDDRVPFLGPDEDSLKDVHQRKVRPAGAEPFVFHNAALEDQLEINVIPLDPPPEILFDGNNLLVCDRIAEKLRDLEIPNLAIQPAVYIDHNDVRHDYWYLTFLKDFDCWDREKSDYYDKPIRDLTPRYEIFTYVLNEELLQKTPLEERLLFEMGGTTTGYVTVHESIAEMFRVEWVRVLPITEY